MEIELKLKSLSREELATIISAVNDSNIYFTITADYPAIKNTREKYCFTYSRSGLAYTLAQILLDRGTLFITDYIDPSNRLKSDLVCHNNGDWVDYLVYLSDILERASNPKAIDLIKTILNNESGINIALAAQDLVQLILYKEIVYNH